MTHPKIIRQAIDLHVHIGPEIIPRKFDLAGLIARESGKIGGIGVKNHFFPTSPMGSLKEESGKLKIIHSVVLNHYAGGFNAYAVKASAELSHNPIIVWFPTIHASSFVHKNKFEIPEEWIDPRLRKKIRLHLAKNIEPLSILNPDGSIRKDVKEVLSMIKSHHAVLATGHLSWQEARLLVIEAIKNFGLKKIILTHPIYQNIAMPVQTQKELAAMGALVEHSYSMHTIDKIPISEIASQIRAVGAEKCILSSDVGQSFSKDPSEALREFTKLLFKEGISERELKVMLVKNPSLLIRK